MNTFIIVGYQIVVNREIEDVREQINKIDKDINNHKNNKNHYKDRIETFLILKINPIL